MFLIQSLSVEERRAKCFQMSANTSNIPEPDLKWINLMFHVADNFDIYPSTFLSMGFQSSLPFWAHFTEFKTISSRLFWHQSEANSVLMWELSNIISVLQKSWCCQTVPACWGTSDDAVQIQENLTNVQDNVPDQQPQQWWVQQWWNDTQHHLLNCIWPFKYGLQEWMKNGDSA